MREESAVVLSAKRGRFFRKHNLIIFPPFFKVWKDCALLSIVLYRCRESVLLCDFVKLLTDRFRYVVKFMVQEYFVPSMKPLALLFSLGDFFVVNQFWVQGKWLLGLFLAGILQ